MEGGIILPVGEVEDVVFGDLFDEALWPVVGFPGVVEGDGTEGVAAEFFFEVAGFADFVLDPVTVNGVFGEDEEDGGVLTNGAIYLSFDTA